MRVIDVLPKDIYVTLEFPLVDLKCIQTYLSESKVEYNSKDDVELAKAVEYIVDKFYPGLTSLLDDLEKDYGS